MWLLVAGTPPAAAQIIGTATADGDTVTVGDPVTLTLTFDAPRGYRPGSLTWSLSPDTLVTLDTLRVVSSADSTWTCRIKIALFAAGTFPVDPSSLLLFGPDGDSLQVAFAPESIHVASVLDSLTEAEGPAGYKPLIEPPGRIPLWAWLTFVAVLALGAALFWYLRRPKPVMMVPAVAAAPPWETARAELDRLSARGYHLRGEPRLFAIELSEILRRYLEGRYGFVALEQTTSEIKLSLKHIELSEPQRQGLLATLGSCDLAKYAKFNWPAPELMRSLTGARAFVDATTPRAEAGVNVE